MRCRRRQNGLLFLSVYVSVYRLTKTGARILFALALALFAGRRTGGHTYDDVIR